MPRASQLNAASFAASLAAALLVAACGGGGDCEKVYEMEKKCNPDKSDRFPSKGDFVEMCTKMKDDPKMKEEVAGALACAKESSCDAYKACEQGIRAKKRAKEVTEAVAAGKWKDAFDDCTLSEDYHADAAFKAECAKVFANADKLSGEDARSVMYRCKSDDKLKAAAPDFAKTCKTLADAQLAALVKTATTARDGGKRDYKTCLELKDAAELAGGDAVAKGKQLCDEMDVAEDAAKAASEARESAAAKKTTLPFRCDSAAEKLAKIDSEWGKKTLADVLKACYVELGAVVVEEEAKDAKYSCPYGIKQVMEGIAKHGVAAKFPEVAELEKKLPAKCTAAK